MEKEVRERIAKNPYGELMTISGISFTADNKPSPSPKQFLKDIGMNILEKLTFLVYQIIEFDRLVFLGERSRPIIYLHLSGKINRNEHIFFYGPTKGGRGKEFYRIKIREFIELTAQDDSYDLFIYAACLVRLRVVANFPTTVLLSGKKLEIIRAKAKLKDDKRTLRFFSGITPAILTEAENCVNLADQDRAFVSHLAASYCVDASQKNFDKRVYTFRLKEILTLDASNYL